MRRVLSESNLIYSEFLSLGKNLEDAETGFLKEKGEAAEEERQASKFCGVKFAERVNTGVVPTMD